jgi:hypothetical protein
MSAYRTLIEKLPDWEEMTEAEAVAAALAKSRTYVDPDRWSLIGIAQIIGPQNMPTLESFLNSIGMGWAFAQGTGAGLPIGDQAFNAALRSIGHPLTTAIADAGRRPASPCELEKLAEDPAKIAEGYRAAKLGALKHEKIVAASQRWNEYNREINRWDGDPATEPSL